MGMDAPCTPSSYAPDSEDIQVKFEATCFLFCSKTSLVYVGRDFMGSKKSHWLRQFQTQNLSNSSRGHENHEKFRLKQVHCKTHMWVFLYNAKKKILA